IPPETTDESKDFAARNPGRFRIATPRRRGAIRPRCAGELRRGPSRRILLRLAARAGGPGRGGGPVKHLRSEEHTSELQSLMRISSAVFCLKQKTEPITQ